MISVLACIFLNSSSFDDAMGRLPEPVARAVGRFVWVAGITRILDVTNDPGWHGDFVVGRTYQLRHAVWIKRKPHTKWLQPIIPDSYSLDALFQAEIRYGDARKAPPGFRAAASPRAIKEDAPIIPTVEEHGAELPLPDGADGSLPAGVQIKLKRVKIKVRGDNTSFYYIAEILDGDMKGRRINLGNFSNIGIWGFNTRKTGYSPNPFILELVPEAP